MRQKICCPAKNLLSSDSGKIFGQMMSLEKNSAQLCVKYFRVINIVHKKRSSGIFLIMGFIVHTESVAVSKKWNEMDRCILVFSVFFFLS